MNPPEKWTIVDAISHCGEYGDPPSYARWGIQVTEWITAVVSGRIISGFSTVLLRGVFWYPLAEGLDSLFVGNPVFLVFFVLVLYPLFCGLIVAWIQDGVLKLRTHCTEIIDSDSRDPLLQGSDRNNECEEIHNSAGVDGSSYTCEFETDSAEESQLEQFDEKKDIDSAYSCSPHREKDSEDEYIV